MKNMKKLLRKAMVFTLTAAMLVGTPLTASAASLVDLYQIEDGWGNVTGKEDIPNTGTITSTGTYSTTLKADHEPVGIYLDDLSVELLYPDKGSLTAKIMWNVEEGQLTENDKKLEADMLKHLDWESDDTSVVALQGKFDDGSRAKIQLNPKAAGTAKVTVSLPGKYNFSDTATVNVKQYATDLAFNKEIDEIAYIGDSIDLNAYVDRYVDGKTKKDEVTKFVTNTNGARKVSNTSDTLTFSLKADPAKAASLKNGVLSIKGEGTVRILAIGQNSKDKVGTEWHTLKIQAGNNAKTIEFSGKGVTKKKMAFKASDGVDVEVTAKVTPKERPNEDCTNKISWSSKNNEVVTVSTTAPQKLTNNESKITLTALKAGKAQIVAKASNGKSATLAVTVSADLSDIKITKAPGTAYSGQTIDLYKTADQYFGKARVNFTDAGLKWTFANGKTKTDGAKITAKGVLTVDPDIKDVTSITVKASNSKKTITAEKAIKLEQVDVTDITVIDDKENVVIHASVSNGKATVDNSGTYSKKNPETVEVGDTRGYTLLAAANKKDGTPITDATVLKSVLGWSASGNGKIVTTLRTDKGEVTGVGKKKTATISVTAASKTTSTKKPYKMATVKFTDKVLATTKTLSLNVKNKGIAATGSKQTITITPVLEKGSTTNKKTDITWTAMKGDQKIDIDQKTGKIKNITLTSADEGKEIVVTARVKNGPGATVKLTIVKQSKAVNFSQKGTLKIDDKVPHEVTVTVDIKNGEKNQTPGKSGVSPVTYTLSKTGVVRIKDLGDGKLEINPVTSGSVKITATTLDGKKKTLSVKVSNVVVADNFWKQNQ